MCVYEEQYVVNQSYWTNATTCIHLNLIKLKIKRYLKNNKNIQDNHYSNLVSKFQWRNKRFV